MAQFRCTTYCASYNCTSFYYIYTVLTCQSAFNKYNKRIYVLIISCLATFLGTNSLSVLMYRKAANQSINQYITRDTAITVGRACRGLLRICVQSKFASTYRPCIPTVYHACNRCSRIV